MAQQPSIYDLEALKRLGVDPTDVGTAMLNLEDDGLSAVLDPEWLFVSEDPTQWWVKGGELQPHVTLLHGLLPGVTFDDVQEVLVGWQPQTVVTDRVIAFDTPEKGYSCLVSVREPHAANLLDAHARLSMLPHVNFYPVYTPHVTVAYVKSANRDEALQLIESRRRMLKTQDVVYSEPGRRI